MELSLSDINRIIVEIHLSVIDEYDEQIERLEEKIERKVLASPAAQSILSIPDGGQTTAALVTAEIGELRRFNRQEGIVSYAGLDPMGISLVTPKFTGASAKRAQRKVSLRHGLLSSVQPLPQQSRIPARLDYKFSIPLLYDGFHLCLREQQLVGSVQIS